MRNSLSLFSLFALMASPVLAQQGGYWSVRPAPPSWGVPAQSTPAANAVPPPANAPLAPQTRVPNGNLQEAVTCAAALQVATLAAPNWAKERGITQATDLWLQRVFALGEPQGITSDKVPTLVQAEMERQTNAAADDPSALSRRAFDCASKPPV